MQAVILEIVRRHGRRGLAVLDLTFAENVSWAEANKRFNSFRTNVLAERYKGRYIVVCERGEKHGRVHFHVLFHDPSADFHTGSAWYWNPKLKRWACNRNKRCQEEFNFFRGILKGYGFGRRVAVTPLRSIEGGARYFSKYVGKGYYSRTPSMFGKQLVRYGQPLEKMHSAKFSFAGGLSRDRRRVLQRLADRYDGLESYSDLRAMFGPRWAYYTRSEMRMACLVLGPCFAGRKSVASITEEIFARWRIKVLSSRDPFGKTWVHGGHEYRLKENFRLEYLGRITEAPDECFEPVASLLTPQQLEERILDELCLVLDQLYDGEQCFSARDLPPVAPVSRPTQISLKTNSNTKDYALYRPLSKDCSPSSGSSGVAEQREANHDYY